MDFAIPLPVLSFLAVPALSSYSTQLNILFFYMTWSTLLLSHSPLVVEFFGTFAIRTLFYTLPSLIFLAFDTAIPNVAVLIKAQGESGLPLRLGSRKLVLVIAVTLFNVALGVAAQTAIDLVLTYVLNVKSSLRITTTLPMPWGIIKDLLRGLVLKGTLQYYIHRYALHDSNSPIAKWHRSWQHSIKVPFSMMANFDHPVCYLVGRWLPVYLPAALFRFHILTYHVMVALLSLEEAFTYSGYSILPSTIILAGMARRVDGHMMNDGQGNFGASGVLDWAFGTSIGGDVMEDLKAEMEKRNVEGRAENAVGNAVSNFKGKAKGKGRKASNKKDGE
ncbi:MAG: hypothetical protein M1822_007908 [Bathelium mastoideum]|nr:MAG: hypothetical protein M1822_007908 [Bathelium mastoideum]